MFVSVYSEAFIGLGKLGRFVTILGEGNSTLPRNIALEKNIYCFSVKTKDGSGGSKSLPSCASRVI